MYTVMRLILQQATASYFYCKCINITLSSVLIGREKSMLISLSLFCSLLNECQIDAFQTGALIYRPKCRTIIISLCQAIIPSDRFHFVYQKKTSSHDMTNGQSWCVLANKHLIPFSFFCAILLYGAIVYQTPL